MGIPAQGQHRRAMLDFSIRLVLDDQNLLNCWSLEGGNITEIKCREKHLDTLQRVLRRNLRNELTATKGYAEILANSIDDPTLLYSPTERLIVLSTNAVYDQTWHQDSGGDH